MNEFLTPLNWFYMKYNGKDPLRFWSEQVALNLLYQRGGKNIVETGTTRQIDDWGGGMSTYLWGDFAQHYDCKVTTVDNDANNIEICKTVTSPFKDYIKYAVSDSIEFLRNYNEKIDLLYLDSVDFPLYPESDTYITDIKKAQEHNLEEFKLAEKNLTSESIILIDDYDFPQGGKPGLTNRYLLGKGWECLVASRQILWIPGKK